MRKFSKFLCYVVVLFVLMPFSAFAQGLLVAWQPGTAVWQLDWRDPVTGKQAVYAGRLVHEADDQQLLAYPVSEREPLLALLRGLRLHPDVIYVERNAPIQMQSNWPTQFASLGLDAYPWPVNLDCSGVAIAVIDTWIDQLHPALDAVGFMPDTGYREPVQQNTDYNHGTHVAGLIAAAPHSGQQVAGICSPDSTSLLSLGVLNQEPSAEGAVKAIRFAMGQDTQVINASWTLDEGYSEAIARAVEDATAAGLLFVAAAGNTRQNLDQMPVYPASLAVSNARVMAVANAEISGGLYSDPFTGSNYGYSQISLAAPGTSLRSSLQCPTTGSCLNRYGNQTGTSMAAPLVSAALAALATRFPNASPEALHAALLNSVAPDSALAGLMRYPGVPNLDRAMTADASDLFRPTWLRYEWDPYVDRLIFYGIQLDEVVEARLFFPLTGQQSAALALDHAGSGQLGVALPPDWVSAELRLRDDQGQALQSVQLPMIQAAAPDGGMSHCSGSQCSIQLADQQVTVQRAYPEDDWWLSTHQQDGREVLVITGSALNDNWQVQVTGHPRLQLNQVWAQNASEQWVQLGAAEGYVRWNARRFDWTVDQIADWSAETAPQRLLLDIQTQVSSGGRCFIATHVYGSAAAPQVESLREFRDQVLMHSSPGRWLVQQYYRFSPTLVKWMADKPRLTHLVKRVLDAWVVVWQKWLA